MVCRRRRAVCKHRELCAQRKPERLRNRLESNFPGGSMTMIHLGMFDALLRFRYLLPFLVQVFFCRSEFVSQCVFLNRQLIDGDRKILGKILAKG